MLPAAARDFYAFQQRVNFTTRNEIKRIWLRIGDDFDAGWRRHGPAILALVVEAQRVVAEESTRYVPRVLEQVGIPDDPTGEFRPESLVGRASDGRSLDSLAYGAVTEAKAGVTSGLSVDESLLRGQSWLDLMAAMQIADVARQAVSVQNTAQRQVSNYIRVLNPPSCQRCAILAGRVYKWSTGFQRHPRCDCAMMPARNAEWAKSEGFITSPREAYEQGHIKDLTKAQIQAIEDGADITRVVNAYRGVSTTATRSRTVVKSTHSTPAPVPAGQPDLLAFFDPETRFRNTKVPQNYPTPEGIYLEAAGDRAKALELLRQFGYIL